MEASLKLLNRYVKVDDFSAEEVAAKLTSIGHEVEGMHAFARGTKLVVGYVHSKEAHPDSDHLNVCQVEVEPGVTTQIVCGAPNVDAGQKVIVALPGCDLGEGFKIKESKVRGVESNGMICSIAELGLDQRLLKEEDKAKVKEAADMDKQVDEIYNELLGSLITHIQVVDGKVFGTAYAILINKYIERAGDHVTNIAEEVLYALKGRRYHLN